ncbi:MAG TPA: hypothetical protein VK327_17470 [Candidatus Paceibacterota bacterium]|nr:hypothetical protein [Candidatus Paceibacterota bacterium]
MRIFLKDKKTGMYYVHSDGWTTNAAHAYDFQNVDIAAQIAKSFRLSAAEIVYSAEGNPTKFSVPLAMN